MKQTALLLAAFILAGCATVNAPITQAVSPGTGWGEVGMPPNITLRIVAFLTGHWAEAFCRYEQAKPTPEPPAAKGTDNR